MRFTVAASTFRSYARFFLVFTFLEFFCGHLTLFRLLSVMAEDYFQPSKCFGLGLFSVFRVFWPRTHFSVLSLLTVLALETFQSFESFWCFGLCRTVFSLLSIWAKDAFHF